ncbi:MAG TPA: DUF1588 domain-containing protein [Polyangia bacterium]|nr:DUF1588 domain-containing protein [Polyangia bacterium]
MARTPWAALIALAALLPACRGLITGPPRASPAPAAAGPGTVPAGTAGSPAAATFDPKDPDAPAPPLFACDASAAPPELPLPRLSRVQLGNTLRFAIRLAVPAEADAIWAAVSPRFDRYPVDVRAPAPGDLKGGYSRFDQSIQQSQIAAVYDTAGAIAQQLTSTPARLAAMMGACATDASAANDRACLEAFVSRWASRVTRQALSADDVAYYADIAGATPVAADAVADVVATVLNSAETLYRVEHGTDDGAPSSPLAAFELAARLSYNLWQEPPDDALWAAAQDGSLLSDAGYEAQLARLLASPKLRQSIDEWVTEWLRLDELPPLDTLNADPAFRAFAGADLPPASARDAMIADVLGSAWAAVASGGTPSSFLGDRHSYATDPYLAGLYGVAPWDGAAAPPTFASARRAGLLTRAAFLATGTGGTRPIHKGYLVRNAVLCQQVGSPPADANTKTPVASGQETTRQAVTERTSGGVCGACHTTIINPPGFITESFDALGRERAQEDLYDAEGNLLASLPIDTSAAPAVEPGDARVMSTAAELTHAIDTSGLFHSCLGRHYFRFAESRVEDPALDGCLLSKLEAAARSNAALSEVLGVVARDATFKAKRFE